MASSSSSSSKSFDVLLKILLVGDSGVGKSSLLVRFADDAFSAEYLATIGFDFKIRTLTMEDGTVVKLQIWDTAGQERFRAITGAYYRRSQGIGLVYDITSERSMKSIQSWIRNIESHAPEGVQKLLIGNKSDLEDARKVSPEEGRALASEYGMPFVETSAKSKQGVNEAFMTLTKEILRHKSRSERTRSISTGSNVQVDNKEEKGKGGCCS